jgi:hypothetical protein
VRRDPRERFTCMIRTFKFFANDRQSGSSPQQLVRRFRTSEINVTWMSATASKVWFSIATLWIMGCVATAHLGMNVRIPTPALASTSRAGLTLYCSRISSTATAMAAVSVPVMAPLAMLKQPASSNPIDTGASPC